MAQSAAEVLCIVCDRAVTTPDVAECACCGQPFHVATREDSTVMDCGRILMNEASFGLIFVCAECQLDEAGWVTVS